jgi:hypothetical protein
MTIYTSYVAQLKPGRLQDALELLSLAAKPLANHGAHNVRVIRSASGETNGAVVMSLEFDSNESFGTWYDNVMADDEIVGLLARSDSADSPYLSQTTAMNQVIPIEGPKDHGPVIQVTNFKPLPGRDQDAINLASRVAQLLGRHGAVGCSLLRITVGGLQSGNMVFVAEYASTAGMGKTTDALLNDPDGMALLAESYAAGSPVSMISRDNFFEIAL